MWARLFEFMRQVLTLTENQKRQEEVIRILQQQVRELSETNAEETRALRSLIERLATELQHQREREEAERKILKLELENHLLRQERGLPPAKPESPLKPEAITPNQDGADSNKP